MKFVNSAKKHGFTLIEIAVVLGVMVALSIFALPSLLSRRSAMNLANTSKQIVAALREAQSNAAGGYMDTVWGVHFDNSGPVPMYALFASSTFATSTRQGSYYTLPPGVCYGNILGGSSLDVVFKKVSGIPAAGLFLKLNLANGDCSGYAVTSTTVSVNSAGFIGINGAAPSPDLTSPSVPTGLVVITTTTSTASFFWNPSTDNIGVAGYYVSRNGIQIGTTASTHYTDIGLATSTTYFYSVVAYDTSNNTSSPSSLLSAKTATGSGINASYVLGQQNFTTSSASGYTQNIIGWPLGLAYDATNSRLFVTSQGCRALVFNVAPGAIANFENASYVLGAPNFTSVCDSAGYYVSQKGLTDGPDAASYDPVNQRIFINDITADRVMVFDANPSTIANGESALAELGQPNFTTPAFPQWGNTQSYNFFYPDGSAYDAAGQRLFVADDDNNRILVFNATSGMPNFENASYVLGQPDFVSASGTLSQRGMAYPNGIAYDTVTKRLFVSDAANNRILVFDAGTSTLANYEYASYVLGQQNFTSNASATSQSGLRTSGCSGGGWPCGHLIIDSTNQRLFVADNDNNRVLIYNVAPGSIANGENASYVIGQPDFTSATNYSPTQNSLYSPTDVAYDPVNNRLFVADNGNNRVLIFDVSNLTF